MKYTVILSLILFFCSLHAQQKSIMGFSNEGALNQIESEKYFDAQLNPDNLNQWMKHLDSKPHHVGSPKGKENAEFIASKFREWGYDVNIEKFNVLFPTPKLRLLELLEPNSFKARLAETNTTPDQLPPYNCFSIDGDVTAELVFVNYGVPADYEELEKRGIDVRGKIVIAKYMGSWRGIKPKMAAEKGAIGCLIYSDPKDDGYFQGDVYPKGAFKNEHGVQRGAVMDLPYMPGDPLTPFYGSTDDAPRIDISEATSLTKIPVLPISYADALPLLRAMEGPVAPPSWRGALPITYHLGPGPAKVRLKLEFNWDLHPAYNVIAKMKGNVYPDEWVIRGNHHDAWVHGANDPISGIVSLMEEARGFGEAVKNGFRPKRTVIYCAWDAEEPGLIGSTEWVETHAEELKEKTVAYINTDGTGRGFLGAGGSHTLERFFDQITKTVKDPQTGVSVYERRQAANLVRGQEKSNHFVLGALGSGSDYSPFFQHLGIAAFNLGFGGESSGGEYHTNHDTYEHYSKYKDPGFVYGVTLAKVTGRTTMRLANAELLPFEFIHFSTTVSSYVDDLSSFTDNLRKKIEKENMMKEGGIYSLAADPKSNMVIPEPKAEVPHFNFAPLLNAMDKLESLSATYSSVLEKNPTNAQQALKMNQILIDIEKTFIKDHGLPKRPWYKHHIYAPGFYTGYGVKTLPGVREAIEQGEYNDVENQINILAQIIEDLNSKIESLNRILKANSN